MVSWSLKEISEQITKGYRKTINQYDKLGLRCGAVKSGCFGYSVCRTDERNHRNTYHKFEPCKHPESNLRYQGPRLVCDHCGAIEPMPIYDEWIKTLTDGQCMGWHGIICGKLKDKHAPGFIEHMYRPFPHGIGKPWK